MQLAAELEKLSSAAQLTEERFHAAEKRAMMEIDRGRSTAGRLLEELEAARQEAGRAVDRHRAEFAELHHQLGESRQKMGSLEGQLKAVTLSRDHFEQEMKAAQKEAVEMKAQTIGLHTEVSNLKNRAETAERALRERKDKRLPKQSVKKSKPANM